MSTVTINWHYVGWAVALLMVLFSFAVSIGLLIILATRGKSGVAKAISTVEADAVKVMATPLGQKAVVDAKEIAAEVLAQMKGAPTPTVPNHPLVSDAIALVEHSAVVQNALANASAALASGKQQATTAPAAAAAK